MLTSPGTKSMELKLSAMSVSSSPSLNRAPALTVSSVSTDRSNDAQHPFSRSHVVEDEESFETGSMRYSPPSPSTHVDLRSSLSGLDIVNRTPGPSSIEFSSGGGGGSNKNTKSPASQEQSRPRSGSYPSPIGRGNSAKLTSNTDNNADSPAHTKPSTRIESSNPFSHTLPLRRDDHSSEHFTTLSSNYMNENKETSIKSSENRSIHHNIDLFNKNLASLSLGNRNGPVDYSDCYSPSNQNLMNNQKQFTPQETIGSSLYSDSFEPLDKSQGQQSSRRELLSHTNNNSLQQVSPSPSGNRPRTYSVPAPVNAFRNRSISAGNTGENVRGLDENLPSSQDEDVGILGRNLSTGKIHQNRNIFPAFEREKFILERPDDFNSQISKGSNNQDTSNMNSMYSSNMNNLQSKQTSSFNAPGSVNARSVAREGDTRTVGSKIPDEHNINQTQNDAYNRPLLHPQLRHTVSDGVQYGSHVDTFNESVNTHLSRSSGSSIPRTDQNMIQGTVHRGANNGNGAMVESAPNFLNGVDRMNRNSVMYSEVESNASRVDGNDMRRYMSQMHPPAPQQHPHYNDFSGPDNSVPQILQQPFDYKTMRPPMQQQNQLNQPFFNQMPMHFQGRHQFPNGQRTHQPHNHPSQSGFNPSQGSDFNRSSQYLDEHQIPHAAKTNIHQTQLGAPNVDQYQRSSHNSHQMSMNQENISVRRGEGGGLTGNLGQMYMPNSSGLPPRHNEEYDSFNHSRSMSSSRISGIDGSFHHNGMSLNIPENGSHNSMKNAGIPNVTPDVGIISHKNNVRNQIQGPYIGRDTIAVQHVPHHDYRNEMNIPPYPRRSAHVEEQVMNANDGDPYSVGGKPRVPSRQGKIGGNGVLMHQHNYMQPSSPQSNRNVEISRAIDMNNGLKTPHGHVGRGSFDSGSYDDGMASGGHPLKMMTTQHIRSLPPSRQNSVRSSQGSESSTSMENVPTIISPYPHETTTTSVNSLPRLVYNVKFKRTQRSFILGPRAPRDVKIGCYVKVEADRGEDLGFVVSRMPAEKYNASGRSSYRLSVANSSGNDSTCLSASMGGSSAADLKQVIRLATHDEVNHLKVKKEEEDELLKICRAKVKTRGLPMTVCDAEYQFDRNKLTFFFEAEGRIDFRELVRDLFSIYKTRIWMQQLDKNGTGGSTTSMNNPVGDSVHSVGGENSVSSIQN